MNGTAMKCVSDKTRWANGLTLLEMVIAIAIMAVVFSALLPQFKSISNSWASKQGNAEALQNGRVLVDFLNRNLAKAVKVTAVSDSSETDGYIEFEDEDAITYRFDIAANNYIEFGVVGDLSDLAGPVSSLSFTCYGLDDLDTAITDVDSIRFIRIEATMVNSSPKGQDKTFTTSTFIRTNGSAAASGEIYTEPTSSWEYDVFFAYNPIIVEIDSTHFLSAYTGPQADGWATVLEVDTDAWTITRKSEYEFDDQKGVTPELVQIDSTHYLCAYGGNGDVGLAVVLTVNPSTWAITKATPVEYDGDGVQPDLMKIDDTHYLCVFEGSQQHGFAVVLTVNPSTWAISVETPFEFDSEKGSEFDLAKIDSTHYLCVYNGHMNKGCSVILTVNSSTWAISKETPFEFESGQASEPALVEIDNTHYLCAYRNEDDNGWAVVLTVNTGSWNITKSTPCEFDAEYGREPSLADINGEQFLCVYQGAQNDGWACVLTVDTGTWAITADAAHEYDVLYGKTPAVIGIDGTTRFLVIWQAFNLDGWACILNTEVQILP